MAENCLRRAKVAVRRDGKVIWSVTQRLSTHFGEIRLYDDEARALGKLLLRKARRPR